MIANPGPWLGGEEVRFIGDGNGVWLGRVGVVEKFDADDITLDVYVKLEGEECGFWLSTGNGSKPQYDAYGVELTRPGLTPLWRDENIYIQPTQSGHLLRVSNDIPLKGKLLDDLITVLQYVQMKEKEDGSVS